MKVIKRTHNQQEAKIIVSFLQSHNIDAELLDGAVNSILPVVMGVRIAVPDDQEAEAVALLKNADRGGARIDEGKSE
ncbi:putative signal transducing protein [Hyphococcus sp.]|uniref:putative signal transducing protein n=1 Tax=Hyphococcus sp. TaxID=2038636 RepID=UPI003CCBCC08